MPKLKIKDVEYTIELLDGDSALIGFGLLARHLTGPLGLLLASQKDGEHPELFASGIKELGAVLADPEMRAFAYKMLEGSKTQVSAQPLPQPLILADGNRMLFNEHFKGRVGDMLRLIWFAIRENYRNFSDALPELAVLQAMLKKATAAPDLLASLSNTTGAPGSPA